jgi:4-carboxymuconolactone decarboxylase
MTDVPGNRIDPAPPATTDAGRAVEARIRAARGEISGLYRVLLNSLPVAEGWETFLTAIRQKTALSPRLRELVILRIAVLNRAPYEFDAHVSYARKAGMSDRELDALRKSDDSIFNERERMVLSYTDAMTRDVQVSDQLFDKVKAAFDSTARVELTATIAAYNMVSRFLVALNVH